MTMNMPVEQMEDLNAWFDQRFTEKLQEHEDNKTPGMAIIATKGTMDMAYPPFILASTAAALGWDVSIFFTFYGLSLLKKDLHLKVTPMGNPAMPMNLPFGPEWLQKTAMPVPTAAMNLPGFNSMATSLMKQSAKNKGIASIEDLRELSLEAEVKMIACQMTVDWFGWDRSDFIEDVDSWVGATSFLPTAAAADVTLFI
jgi:peroxiredoxin family protein